mgnify:CR=1 FL=1
MNQGVVMRKLMSFIGLLLPFAVQAAPVDGYKDLKFGMTLEQARESKLCDSGWRTPNHNEWERVLQGFWMCDQFIFNDGYAFATLRFIGGGLKVIQLDLSNFPEYKTELLSSVLEEKYGVPVVSKKDLVEEDIKNGRLKKRKKGQSRLLERHDFADSTVSLRFFIYNGEVEPATIFYYSPDISMYSKKQESDKAERESLLNSL